MNDSQTRWCAAVGVAGWLALAAVGVTQLGADDGDDRYLIYALATAVAMAAGLALVLSAGSAHGTGGLRHVATAFAALALLAAVAVAWAMPLWMGLLALAMFTAAKFSVARRRAFALIGLSQLAGIAALILGEELEIGPADSYGDHPSAWGISLLVTAAGAIFGLGRLSFGLNQPKRESGSGLRFPITTVEAVW